MERDRAKNDIACEYWKDPPLVLCAIKDVKREGRGRGVSNSLQIPAECQVLVNDGLTRLIYSACR